MKVLFFLIGLVGAFNIQAASAQQQSEPLKSTPLLQFYKKFASSSASKGKEVAKFNDSSSTSSKSQAGATPAPSVASTIGGGKSDQVISNLIECKPREMPVKMRSYFSAPQIVDGNEFGFGEVKVNDFGVYPSDANLCWVHFSPAADSSVVYSGRGLNFSNADYKQFYNRELCKVFEAGKNNSSLHLKIVFSYNVCENKVTGQSSEFVIVSEADVWKNTLQNYSEELPFNYYDRNSRQGPFMPLVLAVTGSGGSGFVQNESMGNFPASGVMFLDTHYNNSVFRAFIKDFRWLSTIDQFPTSEVAYQRFIVLLDALQTSRGIYLALTDNPLARDMFGTYVMPRLLSIEE